MSSIRDHHALVRHQNRVAFLNMLADRLAWIFVGMTIMLIIDLLVRS